MKKISMLAAALAAAVALNAQTAVTSLKLVMGPEQFEGSWTRNSSTPVIFSSVKGAMLSLRDGFAAQADCDWGFCMNDAGEIWISAMDNGTMMNKYIHPEYGLKSWSTRNSTLIRELHESVFPVERFDEADAVYLKKLSIKPGVPGRIIRMNAAGDEPTSRVVAFRTVQRDGKVRTGIIRYDGIAPGSVSQQCDRAAEYAITVRITDPY